MSHGPREGAREEGLCRTLTCLSVAVTRRGHHRESRAQPARPSWGTRRPPPTHRLSLPQHVLPPGPQFLLPGGFSTGSRWGDADSTAAVTHLVTLLPGTVTHIAHTADTEGPSPAPRPTRRHQAHVPQSQRSGTHPLTPKPLTSLPLAVSMSRGHQGHSPFSRALVLSSLT